MFLLNNVRIKEYMEQGKMDIRPFEEKLLYHTYYYFRIGKVVIPSKRGDGDDQVIDLSEKGLVEIPPGAFLKVSSLELFILSTNILALFGPRSSTLRKGLVLFNSPSIDPGFPGPQGYGRLDMALWNPTGKHIILTKDEPVGKILFFDVSDTYPVVLDEKTAKLFAHRIVHQTP